MTCKILVGDTRKRLAELPPRSVHCCVTSPPYWGLRSYTGDPGLIGLEPTFDEHLVNLVHVFREVRRVLRSDGTLWLNYGDSYANGSAQGPQGAGGQFADRSVQQARLQDKRDQGGLKAKDLMMMPARVAMALQADGWWVRSEIIWHKPNPMPESVTDRPTSAHEKVFLLAKWPRYYYDAEAVRKRGNTLLGGGNARRAGEVSGANLRNVWRIPPAPYSGAHFATFPPALVEPCVKAGTSEKGVCAECGAPVVRETESKLVYGSKPVHIKSMRDGVADTSARYAGGMVGGKVTKHVGTTGWSPSCECNAEVVPATVLDPFGGVGTVALVADRLQRDSILIEISPEYAAMAETRIRLEAPMFVDVAQA